MTPKRLAVLIVDDETGDGEILAGSFDETCVRGTVTHPSELDEEDLTRADLILVDFDLGRWPRDNDEELARQPSDGLALAGVLRSVRKARGTAKTPAAFALYSSQLEKISGGLSDDVREHAIARLNNLEWVFAKRELPDHPPLAERVTDLAQAVRLLPVPWPARSDDRTAPLRKLLALQTNMRSAEQAWQAVLECRPPLHELASASNGLALLRWLGHRILPYPCFLVDERWLATRLGVSGEQLRRILDCADNPLTKHLDQVRYQGALAHLLGRRWWRAGLESLMWEWQGLRNDRTTLQHAVRELADQPLAALAVARPVQVVDAAYRTLEEPVDVDGAVRITPDDWPPYADQAWMEISRVKKSPRLRSLVVPDDAERLA